MNGYGSGLSTLIRYNFDKKYIKKNVEKYSYIMMNERTQSIGTT